MKILAILLSFLLFLAPLISCKKKPAGTPAPKTQKVQKEEIKLEEEKPSEEIVAFNPPQRDPFTSLVLKAKEAEAKKPRGLHPLESYSVDEFRLIAIVWNKNERYAMVTVPDGKSYTIKEGTTVGIHNGKVMRIEPKAVYIREFIKDYRGVVRARDFTLKLREEE
ncbi:MAG: pilus assembly protein PilP [Thermodesulfovibrionales bacterium]|nr:pilus assembly protein PilP [Thermodesulfovibrionales bacterium]